MKGHGEKLSRKEEQAIVALLQQPTLQDAADELVWKIVVMVMAFRSAGISGLGVVGRPDMRLVGFLWELGEVAAAGGDIRERLFGPSSLAA